MDFLLDLQHEAVKPYLAGCAPAAVVFLCGLAYQDSRLTPTDCVFILLLLNAHYQIFNVDGSRSFAITLPILFLVVVFSGQLGPVPLAF